MSWLRIEGRMPQHHKIAPLSDAAFRLHITAMAWSVEGKTDGRVPFLIPQTLTRAPSGKKLLAVLKELTDFGIWIESDGAYQIHDFLQWNLSSAEIQARSESKAKSGASGGRRSGEARAKQSSSNSEAPASGLVELAAKTGEAESKPLPKSLSQSEREEISLPPATERKSGAGERCLDALTNPAPAYRADVLRIHEAWKRAFGRRGAKFLNPFDEDAIRIAKALDIYGENDCLLVARYASEDDKVAGRTDENGEKHESIRYLFENNDAFSRILRHAQKRESELTTETPTERIERLKKRTSGAA